MFSIKKLLLLAVALSWLVGLVGQPAFAASNEGLMAHLQTVEPQALTNAAVMSNVAVTIDINWPSYSGENRVTIYDSADTQMAQFCNPDNCYNDSSSSYQATLSVGDLAVGTGYYIIAEDASGDGWDGDGSITLSNAVDELLTYSLSSGGNSGQVPFDVVAPPPVRLIESNDSTNVVEGEATDSYQINLMTIPAGDVEIQVSADTQTQVSLDGSNFASSQTIILNDTTPQEITVQAVDDGTPEGLHTETLTHAITVTNDETNYPTSLVIDSVTVNIGEVSYVKSDAGGSADGTSWANAYPKLQDALAAAGSLGEVWVAAGVYYPDEGSGQTDNAQASTFQLASGVAIYGGFAGTETAHSERNWETNVTVLSGDIDGNDTDDDNDGIISSTSDIVGANAYSVVTGSGTDSSAILDGVTINAGHASLEASGRVSSDSGAGMYNDSGSPTLENLTFTGNKTVDDGAGLYNNNSSPSLRNVVITHNLSESSGGGVLNDSSNPTLTNVSITSNSAGYGGGMYNNDSSNPTLTNVSITSNSAEYGGGMYNIFSSNPTLTNVSITSNSATNGSGGGMYNDSSNPTLTNVIIWNNQVGPSTTSASASIANDSSTPSISYSLIANSGGSGSWDSSLGTNDGGNIDSDPLFVSDGDPSTTPPTVGDYRLQITSPAIDVGNNEADLDGSGAGTTTISDITSDLDGNPRLSDIPSVTDGGNGTAPIVDMGAYEANTLLYVDHESAASSPDGNSWANAYPKLQDALAAAGSAGEIWVAAGVYYPDEGSGQTNDAQASTFQLASGVAIYGGFAGTETARAERNWETNVTVLSGDIDGNDTDDDNDGIISSTSDIVDSNAYHVVTGSGTDSSAILNGVTINAGQANGSFPDNRAGGMYNDGGSPTLTNVSITSNSADYGGGMFNDSSSNPTLTNVSITSNSASSQGGGMFNYSSNPTLTNVSITSNSAQYGGGMYNFSSDPTLTNVSITSNSASSNGGGMLNLSSSNPTLTNVIIWNNQASGSTTSASASIVNNSSTPTISYSLIANSGGSGSWDTGLGADGGNNIDSDPLFVSDGDPSTTPPTVGDYRLRVSSPAIDAGNNNADLDGSGAGTTTISDITSDLDGNSRLADVTSQADTGNGSSPIVDMGAYEAAPPDVQCDLSQGQSYDFNLHSPIPIQIDTLSNIDCMSVYRVEQSYPEAPEGIQTGRYWLVDVVDSTGNEASGFSLSVTLPHTLTTPSDARICRDTGSAWDCDNSNTTADATTVTRTGMSAFSPIAVGNAAQPLAVNLASFTADASPDEIRLEWATVSELDNLGFNLYRATSPEDPQSQLNSELISSQAPGSGQGATYEWLDADVEADSTYYYWLEDVDIHGATSMHGPISAAPVSTTAVTLNGLTSEVPQMSLVLLISLMLMLLMGGWLLRRQHNA